MEKLIDEERFNALQDLEVKEAERDMRIQSSHLSQVGGQHYKVHGSCQPWSIIDEYNLNFYEGNALKYLLRSKGDRIEDLQKAIHYLEKEIENEYLRDNAVEIGS